MDESVYERAQQITDARCAEGVRAILDRPRERQRRDPRGRVICLDCLYPIDQARLQVAPQAVRCVECQQELDRLQPQWGHRP